MGSVRSGREIDSALRRKGFIRETDGDHIHYCFISNTGEKSTIKTKISHGMTSTINADLISKMARQLHLTKRQFLDLVDCNLSEEGYRIIIHTDGTTM